MHRLPGGCHFQKIISVVRERISADHCESPMMTVSNLDAGWLVVCDYRGLPVGYASCRTAEPVSSSDFRLDMIFGQPPDTASISFEGSRSMV
jgi:hypothetical protein